MSSVAAPPPKVGKRYRGTRGADGLCSIFDVPVFGPLPKGERGNQKAIGVAWMEAALERAKVREQEGYLPPVHFAHPNGGSWKSCVFRLTRVGEMTLGGETIPVLFADLLEVPDSLVAALDAGELPYRSVEVSDWDRPEVNALGLLSGDAPYFAFPRMIGIDLDNVDGNSPQLALPVSMSAGLVAAFAAVPATRHIAAVFNFDEKRDDDRDSKGGDDDRGGDERGSGYGSDDRGADDDEDGDGGDAGADPGNDPLVRIEKALAGIAEMLARLLKSSGASDDRDQRQPARDQDPEDPEAEDGNASSDTPSDGPDPAANDKRDERDKDDEEGKMATNDSKGGTGAATEANRLAALETRNAALESENAKLTARVDQLEAGERDRKLTAERTDLVAAARKRLSAKRILLPADFDGKALKFATAGKEILEDYVATLEQTGRTDPPETFAAAMAHGSGEDFPEVAAFAAKGAGMLDAARKAQAEFRAYKIATPTTEQTIGDWLKARGLDVTK